MATTKPDSRNVVQKVPLSRLAPAAGPDTARVELDNILSSINAGLTPPLEMLESSTPDLVLNIGGIFVQDPENLFYTTIPPLNGLIPNVTSETVTFPASSGGNATPSSGSAIVITVSSGNFIKCGIHLNSLGNLILNTGAEGGTVAAAGTPPLISGSYAIGYVVLENVGGTIQNITNNRIYQYVRGSGGGSTSSTLPFTEDTSNVVTISAGDFVQYNNFNVLVSHTLDIESGAKLALFGELDIEGTLNIDGELQFV